MEKKDIQELIEAMRGVFATAQDHVNVEKKIDDIHELINKLPTRDEIENMLERTYHLATIKAEHERIKIILREKLGAEV
ncbi:MAG: hypothetical protein AAB846_02420 [Patescibacteria group bacterium]